MNVPRVLSIAGSDSGGGAGIQADLKTFTALNVYGMSAITAVTAQNTQGVTAVHVLPPEIVAEQIDAVEIDIGVDAVKTGMLANVSIVETVSRAIERHGLNQVVVDPVMIATSGDSLLDEDAIESMKTQLLPLAAVVTPNIPEAEALSGATIHDEATLRDTARAIADLGPKHVLIKGGHTNGSTVVDVLFDGTSFETFESTRIDTKNTHGTGCTLAAAIAAYLAREVPVEKSVEKAVNYVQGAILSAYSLGKGNGPLNHMYLQETREDA